MRDSSDSSGGNDSNDSNDSNDVTRNRMTPELARQLARGAKQQGVEARRPWDGFDRDATPEHRFTLRFNDYDRAIAHYVAGMRGTSVQKALVELLREVAMADIAKREGRRG